MADAVFLGSMGGFREGSYRRYGVELEEELEEEAGLELGLRSHREVSTFRTGGGGGGFVSLLLESDAGSDGADVERRAIECGRETVRVTLPQRGAVRSRLDSCRDEWEAMTGRESGDVGV